VTAVTGTFPTRGPDGPQVCCRLAIPDNTESYDQPPPAATATSSTVVWRLENITSFGCSTIFHVDVCSHLLQPAQMTGSTLETQPRDGCITVEVKDLNRWASTPVVDSESSPGTANIAVCPQFAGNKYAPQFNTAAPLILSRFRETKEIRNPVNRAASCSGGKLGEAGQGKVSEDLWTIPLSNNTARQSGPDSTTLAREQSILFSSRLKRKRNSESELPDFTQSTISFPASMMHSSENTISSSQQSSAGQNRSKMHSKSAQGSIARSSQTVDNLREKQLSAVAAGVSPAKAELVGFHAGEASDLSVSLVRRILMHSQANTWYL
jgi:hypothetical protein